MFILSLDGGGWCLLAEGAGPSNKIDMMENYYLGKRCFVSY
jgi:hypothetical protein